LVGGGIWRRKKKKTEDEELLERLMEMASVKQRIARQLKEMMDTEVQVREALAEIKRRASIVVPPPQHPVAPLPPMLKGQPMTYDRMAIERARAPIRKQELVERLRAGREAKKQREEEIRKQRLKNLSRARRAKKRKNG
jgi:hypothetical protein